MKKLSILLIGLLLVSGMAFAADVPVESSATIEGSASVTFGIDLNEGTTGFYNDGTSSLTVTLVPEQDITVGGDDGVYGEITIEEFSWENGVADGSVSAKLVISPLEIMIFSAPTVDFNNAPIFGNEAVEFIGDDGDAASTTLLGIIGDYPDNAIGASDDTDTLFVAGTITGDALYGITVTVPVEPITLDLTLVSDGDWTNQTGDDVSDGDSDAAFNSENNYAIASSVTVDVAPIEVGANVFYGWFSDVTTLGFGATADVELADILFGLDLGVGVDYVMPIEPDSDFFGFDGALDADFTVSLALTEETDDVDSATIDATVYVAPAWFGQDFFEEIDLDAKVSFSEPKEGGFVDLLYADLGFEFHDLLFGEEDFLGVPGLRNDLNFVISVSGGYDTGDVDPYFDFSYRSDEVTALGLGVNLKEGLTGIDNTTITLDYQADDLTDADPAETNDIGIITLKTSISF
jgi:hypothetical protein